MVFMNPLIEIALIALAMFVFFNLLRHKFTDKSAMEKLKEKQREWKELMKSSDKHSNKKIEEVQKEVMELNFKALRGTMPSMLISFAVIIVIFPLLYANYGGENFPLKLGLPLWPDWLWYYLFLNIFFSIAFAIGKKAWKKYKEKSE